MHCQQTLKNPKQKINKHKPPMFINRLQYYESVSWFNQLLEITCACAHKSNKISRLVNHHHHMALQPNSGPGLPFWGFLTITFLQGWIVSPAPNPQPGGPGLRIYDPRRQGGPAITPQALGTHFSRLLRHCIL
jgi:hypothetical protein